MKYKNKKLLSKETCPDTKTRKELWEDMSEDLPDGAALAMLEEFDLGVEDFE